MVKLIDTKPGSLKFVYDDEDPLWKKIGKVAKSIYHASEVVADTPSARRSRSSKRTASASCPICIAKTQYSFSTDPQLRGAPERPRVQRARRLFERRRGVHGRAVGRHHDDAGPAEEAGVGQHRHRCERRDRRSRVSSFLALAAGALLAQHAGVVRAASDSETAGDVLRVAIPAAAFALTVKRDDRDGRMQFYKSFGATVVGTWALKETVEKERPDGTGDDAFPSGHAATAFQGAAFIHRRYGIREAWLAVRARNLHGMDACGCGRARHRGRASGRRRRASRARSSSRNGATWTSRHSSSPAPAVTGCRSSADSDRDARAPLARVSIPHKRKRGPVSPPARVFRFAPARRGARSRSYELTCRRSPCGRSRAPSTSERSFIFETMRASGFMPQSVLSVTFSAGTCLIVRRMRSAIVSGFSMAAVRMSSTPICTPWFAGQLLQELHAGHVAVRVVEHELVDARGAEEVRQHRLVALRDSWRSGCRCPRRCRSRSASRSSRRRRRSTSRRTRGPTCSRPCCS